MTHGLHLPVSFPLTHLPYPTPPPHPAPHPHMPAEAQHLLPLRRGPCHAQRVHVCAGSATAREGQDVALAGPEGESLTLLTPPSAHNHRSTLPWISVQSGPKLLLPRGGHAVERGGMREGMRLRGEA
jgi:hypothetical protein